MKLDSIGTWRRTHYSIDVNPDMDGAEVTLFGWVQEIRDLGAIRFIILQDREGTIQITVLRKKASTEVLSKSEILQRRYTIGVKGTVKKTQMTPRGVEMLPNEIRIFNTAEPLPIDITGKTIRRPSIQYIATGTQSDPLSIRKRRPSRHQTYE